MERMPIWHIALRRLEMPIGRFLTLYVAPIVEQRSSSPFSWCSSRGVWAKVRCLLVSPVLLFVIMLTLMSLLAAVAFPVLEVQRSSDPD